MHHLSGSARRMWKNRLMVIIDQFNICRTAMPFASAHPSILPSLPTSPPPPKQYHLFLQLKCTVFNATAKPHLPPPPPHHPSPSLPPPPPLRLPAHTPSPISTQSSSHPNPTQLPQTPLTDTHRHFPPITSSSPPLCTAQACVLARASDASIQHSGSRRCEFLEEEEEELGGYRD